MTISKASCNEFNPIQKNLVEGVAELNGKELSTTIEFAKFYLSNLQLRELQKSPEYTALLALHELIK